MSALSRAMKELEDDVGVGFTIRITQQETGLPPVTTYLLRGATEPSVQLANFIDRVRRIGGLQEPGVRDGEASSSPA